MMMPWHSAVPSRAGRAPAAVWLAASLASLALEMPSDIYFYLLLWNSYWLICVSFLIFLDGVGLGANDPKINPLALCKGPICTACWGWLRKLIAAAAPYVGERATLLALDAGQ